MIYVTKELLKDLEQKIGHGCTVMAIPRWDGLELRAKVGSLALRTQQSHSRTFTFEDMLAVRDTDTLTQPFSQEAKQYLDKYDKS